MNRIYRTIFNAERGQYVAVDETRSSTSQARGHGHRKGMSCCCSECRASFERSRLAAAFVAALIGLASPVFSSTLPADCISLGGSIEDGVCKFAGQNLGAGDGLNSTWTLTSGDALIQGGSVSNADGIVLGSFERSMTVSNTGTGTFTIQGGSASGSDGIDIGSSYDGSTIISNTGAGTIMIQGGSYSDTNGIRYGSGPYGTTRISNTGTGIFTIQGGLYSGANGIKYGTDAAGSTTISNAQGATMQILGSAVANGIFQLVYGGGSITITNAGTLVMNSTAIGSFGGANDDGTKMFVNMPTGEIFAEVATLFEGGTVTETTSPAPVVNILRTDCSLGTVEYGSGSLLYEASGWSLKSDWSNYSEFQDGGSITFTNVSAGTTGAADILSQFQTAFGVGTTVNFADGSGGGGTVSGSAFNVAAVNSVLSTNPGAVFYDTDFASDVAALVIGDAGTGISGSTGFRTITGTTSIGVRAGNSLTLIGSSDVSTPLVGCAVSLNSSELILGHESVNGTGGTIGGGAYTALSASGTSAINVVNGDYVIQAGSGSGTQVGFGMFYGASGSGASTTIRNAGGGSLTLKGSASAAKHALSVAAFSYAATSIENSASGTLEIVGGDADYAYGIGKGSLGHGTLTISNTGNGKLVIRGGSQSNSHGIWYGSLHNNDDSDGAVTHIVNGVNGTMEIIGNPVSGSYGIWQLAEAQATSTTITNEGRLILNSLAIGSFGSSNYDGTKSFINKSTGTVEAELGAIFEGGTISSGTGNGFSVATLLTDGSTSTYEKAGGTYYDAEGWTLKSDWQNYAQFDAGGSVTFTNVSEGTAGAAGIRSQFQTAFGAGTTVNFAPDAGSFNVAAVNAYSILNPGAIFHESDFTSDIADLVIGGATSNITESTGFRTLIGTASVTVNSGKSLTVLGDNDSIPELIEGSVTLDGGRLILGKNAAGINGSGTLTGTSSASPKVVMKGTSLITVAAGNYLLSGDAVVKVNSS